LPVPKSIGGIERAITFSVPGRTFGDFIFNPSSGSGTASVSAVANAPSPIASSDSAVGAGAPQHVAGAVVVDPAAQDEEVVGETVQVFERLRVDRLAGGEFADQPLG
jgi:hypothetical protein